MDRIKTFGKYVIWIILFYLFTMLMTYIGFNSTYRNMEQETDLPKQIKIDVAQSTKVNGRIFGEVTTTEENDLNGKYIKIKIYDRRDELVGVKNLKMQDLNINEPKKFIAYFTAENVKTYSIDIVEDNAELQNEIQSLSDTLKGVFKDKELTKSLVWAYVLWALLY